MILSTSVSLRSRAVPLFVARRSLFSKESGVRALVRQ
jgi:hypothetical protein